MTRNTADVWAPMALIALLTACSAHPFPAVSAPAEKDPDFPFQGEFVGSGMGAQVIALGHGEFVAVFEPGGLPGAGWNGRDRFIVNGRREGTAVIFGPGVTTSRSVDTGGSRVAYRARIERGSFKGTTDKNEKFLLTRVVRDSPTLGQKPPPGALVLFDGSNTDEWVHGPKNKYPATYFPGEGSMTSDGLLKEGATTVRKFGDCRLHVEFREPFDPANTNAYSKGNSGVFIQARYEININDSFGLLGGKNDGGVIWRIANASMNMSFPPLSWQTYDVDFASARWQGSTKLADARMTVWFNGVKIHDDVPLPHATDHHPPQYDETALSPTGPIFLQLNPAPEVVYRNIWIVEKTADRE